jgi:hypothetical protein
VNTDPLQIAEGVSVLLNTGFGLTVTTTFWPVGPFVQPLALIITTYVTTSGVVVVLVNASAITTLLPVVPAGVIPATVALLHVYVIEGVALVGV